MKHFNERHARGFAQGLSVFFICIALFYLVSLALALLGRVEVTLVIADAVYERALLLSKDPAASARAFYITFSDMSLRVNAPDGVSFGTWLSVSLLSAVRLFPALMVALNVSRLFGNIAQAQLFTLQNVRLLHRGGCALLLGVALWLLAVLALPALAASQLSVGATLPLSSLAQGFGLLVAAYVMRYGLYLQDEADQTL